MGLAMGGTLDVEEFERDVFIPSKLPQVFAALAITIGAYGIGNVCAWSSPALPDIEASEYFGNSTDGEPIFDSHARTWCASIVPLAALIGGPVAGFMVQYFGRRKTALIIAFPFTIGWSLITFAPTVLIMICARFITGLCVGGLSVTIPLFIAEITEDNIRGVLSNIFPIMVSLGILATYAMGSIMSWFQLSLVNTAVPINLFVLVYLIPESPVYLLQKGSTDKARKSLKWLRGADSTDQIEKELQQLRRGIDEKRGTKLSVKEFFSPPVLKPNLICLALMFFQQMSGINIIIFYTKEIFESAETSIDDNISACIVGIVLLVSVLFSCFYIDKLGRRILLILSAAGMSLGMIGLGTFFYLKEQNDNVLPDGLGWLPLTSLMIFVFAFNFGYGPVPWVFLGEILPSHVKGFGAGLSTGFNWFLAFLITKTFEDFKLHLGLPGCFWTLGIISIVGTLFSMFFVPETKGKTLDEIQQGFQ